MKYATICGNQCRISFYPDDFNRYKQLIYIHNSNVVVIMYVFAGIPDQVTGGILILQGTAKV